MNQSQQLFERACQCIPGGVNSPVRSFRSVGGNPVYIERGSGSKVYDADGREYIDFCGSWGPLLLGHAPAEVVKAVRDAAENGLSFGACCPSEVEFAELLTGMMPSDTMIRLVNSGTEAVMTALRLARAYTGRNKILKFDGCYHGHVDYMLVSAGSGLLTNAMSDSKGIPESVISEVISVPYNDLAAVETVFLREGRNIAAIIVEPVVGNMGLVMPESDFLPGLRRFCDNHGACLIFDEVITGFRFHAGPYATLAGVKPDITTFGKIIGGGMPMGGIAGDRKIMSMLAPLGPVYQAGTLSGNPIATAAGIATLKLLKTSNPYPRLAALAGRFASKVNTVAADRKLGVHCAVFKGIFTIFFSGRHPLRNLDEVKTCDTALFASFFRHMLKRGFYMSPSQFELNFISAAHTESEIDAASAAACEFFDTM